MTHRKNKYIKKSHTTKPQKRRASSPTRGEKQDWNLEFLNMQAEFESSWGNAEKKEQLSDKNDQN